MNRKINIGITVNTSDPYESIFSNGIRQNIIILRELYEKCENVGHAYIINVSNVNFSEHPKSTLYRYREHIISVAEAKDKCDLIVVCHGALS